MQKLLISLPALIVFVLLLSIPSSAQSGHTLSRINQRMISNGPFNTNNRVQSFGLVKKRENVLKAARILGVTSGSVVGMLNIYWNQTGQLDKKVPFMQSMLYNIPVCLVGSFVGYHTSQWAARRILAQGAGPGKSLWYGALYEAINGAAVLSSSLFVTFLIGHYTNTIHFNFKDQSWMPVKLMGLSILGGTLYGGIMGAAGGLVIGPSISFYMDF